MLRVDQRTKCFAIHGFPVSAKLSHFEDILPSYGTVKFCRVISKWYQDKRKTGIFVVFNYEGDFREVDVKLQRKLNFYGRSKRVYFAPDPTPADLVAMQQNYNLGVELKVIPDLATNGQYLEFRSGSAAKAASAAKELGGLRMALETEKWGNFPSPLQPVPPSQTDPEPKDTDGPPETAGPTDSTEPLDSAQSSEAPTRQQVKGKKRKLSKTRSSTSFN